MSEQNTETPNPTGQPAAPATPPAPPTKKSKTIYVVLWAAMPAPDADDPSLVYRILGDQIEAYNTAAAKELALEQADEVDRARVTAAAKEHGVIFQAVASRSWEMAPTPSRLVVHEPEWEIN